MQRVVVIIWSEIQRVLWNSDTKDGQLSPELASQQLIGCCRLKNQGNQLIRVRKNKQQIGQYLLFACCLVWPVGHFPCWARRKWNRRKEAHHTQDGAEPPQRRKGRATSGAEKGQRVLQLLGFLTRRRFSTGREQEVRSSAEEYILLRQSSCPSSQLVQLSL